MPVVSQALNGYEFTARTRFDRLFEGLFVPLAAMPDCIRPLVGDRRGLEYIDSEFSRVLERAQNNHPGVTPYVPATGRRFCAS